MPHPNKITEEKKDRAWQLRAQGYGHKYIAETLGIGIGSIGKILKVK